MADAKQILVVDDHFEMLEFLRSMLELSNQDCEVLAVPSAEEGLLELRRAQFDLLITDVRLPGMSGFDLVRRVKALGREMPVIMITAYSSNQGRKEATDLGVYRYFQKPLDTDSVLTAVHTALHGESVTLPPAKPIATTSAPATAVSDDLQRRLDALRVDTGAMHLTLASAMGDILFSAGDGRQFDLPKLMSIVADNLSNSFLLADELGATEPFTLQYHVGDDFEFYCANVGRHHFLTLFFDMAARRGRIGTIWVFTQRAIKELLLLLNALPQKPAPAAQSVIQEVDAPVETAVPTPRAPQPKQTASLVEEETPPPADYLDIAPDELMDLLSGSEDLPAETADLDAFWDTALTDDTTDNARGISLEEALEKGLIDFGQNQNPAE